MRELHFFDPNGEVGVLERTLPHWSQSGVVCFISFRTFDSMPSSEIERFHADRRHWLRCHRIDPDFEDWRSELEELSQTEQGEFYRTFSKRWHASLDSGWGACLLARPELSKIVSDSMLFFDGNRYELTDFVVMPHHCHLLVAFEDGDQMLAQCENWKRYTARAINQMVGRTGKFWQQDGFDHLVRSVEQFEHFRRYIANNPVKANLSQTSFHHYTKAK